LVWSVLGLALLTFCGGKTEHASGGNGGEGTAGSLGSGGFAGHTASCGTNPCQQMCGCRLECGCAPGGTGGVGGVGGTGTTGCDANPCAPGCEPACVPDSGDADLGDVGSGSGGSGGVDSSVGDSGSVDSGTGTGGGGIGGVGGMNADSGDGEASPDRAQLFARQIAVPTAPAMPSRACYTLSGYEPDPCLPADDTLLAWFGDLPTTCQTHVVAGPFLAYERDTRACCYSVSCDAP
jgi:hypothetical protein